ncbi:MAG: LptF/LptG family permease [Devosiaceae bacterium]|nr:LptF/LptG family permease [Devosiaceae bacterium]
MISRLDWFTSIRVISRVLVTVFVFFCLIFLSEFLDSPRFARISAISGDAIAWLAVLTSSIRWTIKTLSITVLLGSIIALMEFQSRREFVVMKASGISIWRILRGPVLIIALFGILVTTVAEGVSTKINREINPTPPGLGGGISRGTSDIWLQQSGPEGEYFIRAQSARENGATLHNVLVFPAWSDNVRRITAQKADYLQGQWVLNTVNLISVNGNVEQVATYVLETDSTLADLRVTLGSTEDFTFFELIELLGSGVSDPAIRAAATTRLAKLTSLPLLLVGSLLIAFAFTAGYQRNNAFGMAILYGIIMGFVVFVITEMADRAGSSGVLNPTFATWGPAMLAVLIGVSVLLKKEDGRA